MKSVDFLVIGGGAAGTTAAEVIRGLLPSASVSVISEENYEEYSKVLLSHYIRKEITRDKLFLKKPEWYSEKNIELVKGARVVKLDANSHVVGINNGEEYKYGKVLIATGGEVIKLPVPGGDLGNVLYLRTIDDSDAFIKSAVGVKKAIVIGGGFLSLDLVTGLKANGVGDITILVMEEFYWQGKLDSDSSRVLQNVLEKNGVKIVTGEEADHFDAAGPEDLWPGGVGAVVTKSGKRFECDLIGIGIGIRTSLEWLAGSGIKIDKSIVTNEYLETNLPDVYSAGDCAQFQDVIFNLSHIVGTWANATSQGLAVAKTMTGQRTLFETASSYSDTFFEGSYSFIGMTSEDYADEVVVRGSVEAGKVTRIFIKTIGGVTRVVGASVINNPAEVPHLTMAVKNRVDIAKHKDKLVDSAFSLSELNSVN